MSTDRPNILFICTDQQRYDSLGCYGNRHARTPNIDRLAEEGALFEQCYVQNPVCAPSRASLVTGQYPHSHGLWGNGVTLPEHEPVFSKSLADSGYTCGMVGKMHLSHCFAGRTEPRRDDGFTFYKWAHDPSHTSPENDYHHWLKEHHPDLFDEVFASGPRKRHEPGGFDTIPTEAHYSRWVAERAIQFLEGPGQDDAPFFLWANFFDPHHPFVAPQEYLDRFDPASLPQPVGTPDELKTKPAIQSEASRASYAGHARGYQTYEGDEIQKVVAAYYAMVSLIDDETGRILDALERSGRMDNTLVIFSSDHGEMLGDHHLLLKGPMLYDGAIRVPLVMRWPGHIPAGRRVANLVEWIDLTSTFTDVAQVEPMAAAQGASLLPLASGATDEFVRDWALCEYLNSGHPYDPPILQMMLRHGQYKLIVQHPASGQHGYPDGELYDLEADPNELVNHWDDPAFAATKADLVLKLAHVQMETINTSLPRPEFW